MSAEVVMPQMGESIAEGTITKWLKKVGDKIERDEMILEIGTDKVDAEVPATAAGILREILVPEGETVLVGAVLAIIDDGTDATAPVVAQEVSPAPAPPSVVVETPAAPPVMADANAVEVVMPQMGESIAEGTITKWLKKIGDTVERDEMIFEISTDKVDAEIPSPAAGVLLAIHHGEGETVTVGTVVGLVGAEGATVATAPAVAPAPVEAPKAQAAVAAATPSVIAPPPAVNKPMSEQTVEELRRTRSSPLVRNIAKEHGLSLAQIAGTGISGRVTKKDIMGYIESGAALSPAAAMATAAIGAALPVPAATQLPAAFIMPAPTAVPIPIAAPTPAPQPATGDRVEAMTNIRKKIAEHMVMSRRTSAHVSTVYEIDMTNVVKQRERAKASFLQANGTKLTFMPFIFQAVCAALRKFPVVNAQVSGSNIIYKQDINLGMAVALDWGLLVPVIKHADNLSLAGLAKAANDLADRARSKKLKPDEVAGGTFTITNPGVFGGLFGTPIINQPQVAILGVGAIVKRPMVKTSPDGDDYIAIRSMAYFALTFDHRIIDGSDAERFLSHVKEVLENAQFAV